ncbi:MAG: ankyrin repeat domain-containing protein [Alphaproteobacteria bacterium]|nr:ankyrin repeat domain-containing protein [Alphaproteobacteria bacterium]
MKKLLLTCALGILMSAPVQAAPQKSECAYSPLQTLVRDARDATQIQDLINKNVNFDEVPRCGGTLMQLAIRRGNWDVLQALLSQDLKRANQIVSLDDFPIEDAPKKVPLILFAAYYAPNEYIIQLLQQANVDITQTDEKGRNILWYMEQNPVLRKTKLFDDINMALLTSLGGGAQGVGGFQPAFGQNQMGGMPNMQQPLVQAPTMPAQQNLQQPGKQPQQNPNLAQKSEVIEPTK